MILFTGGVSLSREGISVQGGGVCPGGVSVGRPPYGQLQAGGTHPTGINSCLNYDFIYSLTILTYMVLSH